MTNYTLRIPEELYEEIRQAAESDERSIHGEILWLIGQGLRRGSKPVPTSRADYQRAWYRQRRREWIAANGPCVRCGSWANLEVDHIDPAQKTLEISLIWSRSEEVRAPELAKCQVLCKPCHYEKTLAEGSQMPATHGTRNRYDHGGCRCELCRAANAAAGRRKRASKKAREQATRQDESA